MNDNLNEQSTIEQETTGGAQMPGFGGRMHGRPGFDGSEQPPTLDGSEQPPTLDGRMHGRSSFGGMQPQGGFGGMQPQGNMWGNESFAGEDMLSSNNFASQNSGAPGELSGIVDTSSADISVNIGEQNNFGNFAQGGMMFVNQGGQGMQFNQPQQNNRMQAR